MFENEPGATTSTQSFLKRSDSLFSLNVWERGQNAAELRAALFQSQAEGFSTQSPRMFGSELDHWLFLLACFLSYLTVIRRTSHYLPD